MQKNFEMIAKKLQSILPQNWEKVCLYSEIEENSYETVFYCFIKGNAQPIQCYNLVDEYEIEEDDIDDVFYEINKILKSEWIKLKEKGKDVWTNYTFILESNGKFFEEYDYSDLSEGAYDYKKTWKEKYLK